MNLAPEWLTRRGGRLKRAGDDSAWFVMLGDKPQYTLITRPVAGKVGCLIKETNSGLPIESSSVANSSTDALAAGLEDLRHYLGW
jgi:hypothetical protein